MSSSTGTKKDAFKQYGTAAADSSQLGANAQNIYGSIVPSMQAESVAPQGYTPQQKSAITTAGEQSAGGSMAGATGQGALLAARTRNAGAGANAIQQAGRQSSEDLSKVATGTEIGSANLAERQKEQARTGLEGIGGTELGGSLKALGLGNESLSVLNNAQPSFWENMANKAGTGVISRLTSSAKIPGLG